MGSYHDNRDDDLEEYEVKYKLKLEELNEKYYSEPSDDE